jgi:16S rRNA (adenine1518-N6/adenine1519-N6)-dimethyltransferase
LDNILNCENKCSKLKRRNIVLTTSEIIRKYQLQTKKSFGQNFLLDSNLTDRVAKCAGDLKNFEVLEIGPGPGGLTQSILRLGAKKVVAFEMDECCVNALMEELKEYGKRIKIVQGDAIKLKETDYLKPKFKVIANLPYNVGTVLLFKWLGQLENFESLTLMFQKEVAERIVAKPNTKQYGRLSVMNQFVCDVKKHFDIKPSAFTPPPKVMSSVITLYPRKPLMKGIDMDKLSLVCKTLFGQRRKVIRNTMKKLTNNPNEFLEKLNINQNKRPEQLTLIEFGTIAKNI